MVINVASSALGSGLRTPANPIVGGDTPTSLQGQIQQDQIQLNDWTTCVSANTPKGQAAIQKLSGEISAAKERLVRTQQARSSTLTVTYTPRSIGANAAAGLNGSAQSGAASLDVWA